MITSILESDTVTNLHKIRRLSFSELENCVEDLHNDNTMVDNKTTNHFLKYYARQGGRYGIYEICDKNYFLKKVDFDDIDMIYFATPSNNSYQNTVLASSICFNILMKRNKTVFSPMSYFYSLIGDNNEVSVDWDTWSSQCKKFMDIFNTLVINSIDKDLSKGIEYINNSKGVCGELEHHNDKFYIYNSFTDSLYEAIELN
jgi:hypothetical protein